MDAALELKQLIQNRKDLIDAHRKNNFTDGIHALLTDLYPDTAHFIYELLQNAEDMKATVVRFILDKNSIDFEHNGTKRSFNIADIDAITNIGNNNQKKNDTTSIGKFGVGFKAVFAYTSTPIIHSGDYHFKIKDYFVPEFDGVAKVITVDNDGVAWTKFSFPFNNPKKNAQKAFDECLDGLKALDSSAILFLQNIKKIEYMFPSGEIGYAELIDNGRHHVTVAFEKPNESKESSRWLRFERMVNITDDQGNPKTLSTAIAFPLEYDEKNKKDHIVPVKGGGRTFIYFPAEKEHSGLRFHINAPFASTVARDSVRDCEDNNKLISAISQLVVDSLPEIKAQGLMDLSFFEVLPHNKDNLNLFYHKILEAVCSAFQDHDYLPTKNGGYTSARNALAGPAAISDVFKESDMQEFFDIRKTWIKNAAQRFSDADNFIQSLGVQKFEFKDFARIFEFPELIKAEQLLKARAARSREWLKLFYALCSDACEALDLSASKTFVQNMKQALVIRSSRGEMYRSSKIYILPAKVPLITKTTPFVEPTFIQSSAKTDRTCEKIRAFFINKLGIREYGPKVEVENSLYKYEAGFKINEQPFQEIHFQDLIAFAKYQESYSDIDFSKYPIFLYLDAEDNILHFNKASGLFLGKAYGNDSGEILASVYGEHCLWDGYCEQYSEQELKLFIAFANKCGIARELTIEEQSAEDHPLYDSLLHTDGRHTEYGYDFDCTIPELEKLLKVQSIQISEQIWKILKLYGYNNVKFATAQYAPNGSVELKTCDSTLIYYLKQYAWLPDKQGKLFRPKDISPSDLPDNFAYDPKNSLLAALKIGMAEENQNREHARLQLEAEKAGMYLLSKDEYQQFQQWKAQEEFVKNIEQLSGRELLNKQQKLSIPDANAGDDFSTDGAVNNVSRREKNIEKTFRNAVNMKPAQRKLFGCVADSSKEERMLLRNWYQGKCQICNTVITKYDQTPYFVAKNVINTQHLSASIRQTTSLAWNSLCLCPNCAAKYDVCSRDLSDLYDQIMETDVTEGDSERIALYIELDGDYQEIQYVPKHFLALKKVMQLIDEEIKDNESET